MAAVRVLLLRTAGTNCDAETAFAFEKSGASVTPVHVRALAENTTQLNEYSILALPGGFSYGDDLGSGVVLANELTQRLEEPLRKFIERGGMAIGICNGFQVLVKSGLLPGVPYRPKTAGEAPGATLTHNDSLRFEDRWIWLRVEKTSSPFLEGAAGKLITLPVAHGEGKFVTRDSGTLQKLEGAGQVAFRYTNETGGAPSYPENPNGSQNAIAGVVDETGRVLGLMPHPERHVLPLHHPRWTREGLKEEGDGLFIFKNAVKNAK